MNDVQPRRRLHDLLLQGFAPRWVAVGSVIAVVVIVAITLPFQGDLSRAIKAMLLVLPVVGAAVLGGRMPGYVAAVAAAIGFAVSLPPVGSIEVEVAEDVVALAVFGIVAVVVTAVVSSRIDALEDVDRQRSLLLRSVSHDLRTPLATIRGAATELLGGVEHEPATRDRLLRLIDLEAGRLDRLVANLMELSRIESGAMVPHLEPIDPAELARDAAERFRAGPARVPVRLDTEPRLPIIDVDPIQIGQVLVNLIDNAIRHSPDGAEVTVATRGTPRGVEISVSDRGPGVRPEEAELILQPFRSGSLAGSSGVGLAISRVVLDRHGGTIAVDDQPGGGARFTITLPAGKHDPPRRGRSLGR